MNRLHALTDGVYAIAMTPLVLGLHVPDPDLRRPRSHRRRLDLYQRSRIAIARATAAVAAVSLRRFLGPSETVTAARARAGRSGRQGTNRLNTGLRLAVCVISPGGLESHTITSP